MDQVEPVWITRAQKGSAEAFTHLVEVYQTPVFNLCLRMLGGTYEAEDAAQETFLRAYQNLKRYDDQRSFSTWLLSIAAHYCIDQIRKRRMTLISLDDTPYLDPPDQEPGPEAVLSQREQQKRIEVLLSSISPQDRAMVVMRYWYDLSYDEIAESLSLTVSAVKSRLHRARLSLAQTWVDQESKVRMTAERRQDGKVHSPAY